MAKKQKKVKNELVFDNQKREEFLKGFSKRKLQRKKKAQEETEKLLKEEKKRIKDEVSLLAGLVTYLEQLTFVDCDRRQRTSKTSSSNPSSQLRNSKMC
jgi:Nucleolar protein 12 (25kDa)